MFYIIGLKLYWFISKYMFFTEIYAEFKYISCFQ